MQPPTETVTAPASDGPRMGVAQRRAVVRDVLADAGVPLRSIDVHRACVLQGAAFSHRSTKNYLATLVEAGDVLKVDSDALDDGAIVEIDTTERGHFIAADAAEQYRSEGDD